MFKSFAFVDLETTGTTATCDRITEVGIVQVDNDGVREWHSLVNPETRISPFIESLTGITQAMVDAAPTFAQLAHEIRERLEGRLFLAHNARFDHGFLRNEFARVGYTFKPEVLCTVKLSRHFYPGFARHNLDSLIARHQLVVCNRHRALGDARLIWQFWQHLQMAFSADALDAAVCQLTARAALPSQLDAKLIDTLPNSPGVYQFFGDNDLPLYIGKAVDIRKRVLSHFSGDYQRASALAITQQIRRIEWVQTGGEIGALLLESAMIKRLTPMYNRQLRRNDEVCAWRLNNGEGGAQLTLASSDELFFGHDDSLYGPFQSPRKATQVLRELVAEHQLCPVLTGLEKHPAGRACFASQLQRCRGACCGRESPLAHQLRLIAALQPLRMQAWPYAGPIALREGDECHVIDAWAYLGSVRCEADAWELALARKQRFDRDVYQILRRRLPKLKRQIVAMI